MRFDIIYIDCPWKYYGSTTKMAAAGKHYSLMSLEDIKALPIKELCKKKAAVFVWATGPRLPDAIHAIEAWGLHYRGVAFVWAKTNKAGELIHGQGVPPTFTKPTTELLLLATTTSTGRPIPLQRFNTPQVVGHPRGAHSEKPEIFRQLIEETFIHSISKLEVFARKEVPGWMVVGNEIDGQDIQQALQALIAA